MKKSYFYCFFILFQSVAMAQEYKEGKIMLTNNQEKTGLVRVASLRSLSKGCTFKELGKDSVVYNANNLIGFELGGQRFIKHSFGEVKGTSFVLVLNEGKLSLYQDHEGFYVKNADDTNLLPLIRTQKRLIRGDFVNIEIYKYQLDSLFRPCPAMSELSFNTDYSTTNLSQLVGKYNKCIDPTSKSGYTITVPKAVRKFGVRVLGSIANMSYFSYPNNKDAGGNMFGLGVFFSSMGGSVGKGRLGTQIGLDYAKYDFGDNLNHAPVFIQVPLLMQYALSATNASKPIYFVEGGIQANIQANKHESLIVPYVGDGNFALSLPVGAGVQGKLGGGIGYTLSVRYFRLTSTNSNRINCFNISAGIMF